MIKESQIVLMKFPQSNLAIGKLRPVLVVRKGKDDFGDWIVCMVSSQVRNAIRDFDEVIGLRDDDFAQSGLKGESVVRVGRVFTANESVFKAILGSISSKRLYRIRQTLSAHIKPETKR